jgi:hypothetical protein
MRIKNFSEYVNEMADISFKGKKALVGDKPAEQLAILQRP